MFKEQRFLEENIDRIQDYKKSDKTKYKDGYDKWEKIELKFGEALTKIFFEIEEKLKTKEHKALFKEWFVEELNELYKDGLSPTEYRNLENILKDITNKLDYINSYEIETNLRLGFERIVKSFFSKSISNIEKEIILQKTFEKDMIITNFIKKIPFSKTNKITRNITLDKKWSIFGDIDIKMINLLNFGIQTQFFNYNTDEENNLIIKNKKKFLKYQNIEDFSINYDSSNIEISFNYNNKKIIYFNRKNKLYSIGIPLKYYLDNIDTLKHFLYSKFALEKNIKIDYLLYKKKQKIKKEKKTNKEGNKIETYDNSDFVFLEMMREKLNNSDNINIKNKDFLSKPPKERLEIINNFLDSPEMKKFYNMFLNRLLELTKDKRLKQALIKNKKGVINNLKKLVLYIIHIESDGNPLVHNNEGSSAKGLGQWLTGNGLWGYEYKGIIYNKKDLYFLYINEIKSKYPKISNDEIKKIAIAKTLNLSKEKSYKLIKKYIFKQKLKLNDKEINNTIKKVRQTSSWETRLNQIYLKYHEKISKIFHWFPSKEKIEEPFNIKPTDLLWKEQIEILVLSFIGYNQDNLINALLGNEKAKKQLYKEHHTNPDKKTKHRMDILSKYYLLSRL